MISPWKRREDGRASSHSDVGENETPLKVRRGKVGRRGVVEGRKLDDGMPLKHGLVGDSTKKPEGRESGVYLES